MPITDLLFHGLAHRHRDGERTWIEIGQGGKSLRADADGVTVKGKRHSWRDVEKVSVSSTQRSPGRSAIEAVFALIGNQPGTQAGTFVSLLLKSGAFEKTYRCGPPVESATEEDDVAATSLLMRLRDSRERSEFFGQ